MLSEQSQTHILQIVCLLWRIWKPINKVVFENTNPHVRSLARQFSFQVREVLSSRLPAPLVQPRVIASSSQPLECPPEDYLKINFDVAVQASGYSSGLVVRGSDDHVLLASDFHHPGISDPYLAELLAARDAISLAASRSLPRVIIEGDAAVVIRQLSLGAVEDSVGGPILRDCRLILGSLSLFIEFRAVPRTTNWAAHRMTRIALLMSQIELASFDFVGWFVSGVWREFEQFLF
ncbi:unnamed protein product [Linum trigynum]|uniref:RNase H type-1 domain-containing protein n=1 Tax=Linum trigynum TaxID=586398 RepID=A0AAV2DCJ0_9ROSI